MVKKDVHPNTAFTATFSSGRLLHAYIVVGPEGEERDRYAYSLAAAMLCEGSGQVPCGECRACRKTLRRLHPDILTVTKPEDKTQFTVDPIRDVRADAAIAPNEAKCKVYIFENCDLMNDAAQNALLKTLEEPPAHSCFILKVENPSLLRPTVRSRCAELISPLPIITVEGVSAELAARLSNALEKGAAEIALFFCSMEKQKISRDDFEDFLQQSLSVIIRKVAERQFPSEWLEPVTAALQKAGEYLNRNVNQGHIIGMLCACLTDLPECHKK